MKEFFNIVGDKNKLKIKIFTLSSLIFLILETVGVGILPVYLALLDDPNILNERVPLINNIEINNTTLIYLTLFLLLFFVVKNMYFVLHNFLEVNLSKNLKFFLSKELLKIYLKKNYSYHLENNPNILGRNVTSDINSSVSYIKSSILIYREAFQILFISAILMYANFLITVVVIISISVSALSYFYFLKSKIKNMGKRAWYLRGEKSKIIYQTLNSIVEVLIYNKKNFLSSKFEKTIDKEYSSILFVELVNKLPKILIESLIVILFCLFLLFSLNSNQDIYSSIPTLALFSIAAIRIYPSFTNLILHKNARVENKACVTQVINHFKDSDKHLNISSDAQDTTWGNFENKIEIKSLNFSHTGRNILFEDVNLEIKKNSFVGIVGKTGSGKSTLLNILLGLINTDKGKVLIDNIEIENIKTNWQNNISYVPQNTYLFDDTIKENILFGDEINEERLLSVLRSVQLTNFVNNLPQKLETIVGNEGKKISGGERQRIGIARALYKNKNVLILDEITSNLDGKTENKIIEIINNLKKQKTIIMISHNTNILKSCDKILEIVDGQVNIAN